jgi:hypothetical protein
MGLFGKSPYEKQCEEFERQQAETRRQLAFTSAQQEEFERQQVEAQQQMERTRVQQADAQRLQAEYRRQLEEAARLLEVQQENARRTAALVDRCDELARRFAVVLARWEAGK